MNRIRLISVFCACFLTLCSQNYPVIGAYTIIPTSYFPNYNPAKIVTKTHLANQGGLIIKSLSITATPLYTHFQLKACFWEGLLTVPSTFVDTTILGFLTPLTTYSISYTALLSSSMNSCIPIDSNRITFLYSEPLIESVHEWNQANLTMVYPNPVEDVLHINNNFLISDIQLYNTNGETETFRYDSQSQSLDLSQLKNGIYLLCIQSSDRSRRLRIVKLKGG